jgi:glycosyltransferase involved in cell wall biosynthesis
VTAVAAGAAGTVAIPVRNGGPRLGEVLAAVRAQRTPRELRLLVCDSGSTDGSPAVARDAGARVIEIAPESFSHGATRNLLMQAAATEHVAFLTQDAVPASDAWLETLLAGFDAAPAVGLVFGPYVPAPGASPMVRRELTQWFASLAPDGRPTIDRLQAGELDVPAIELLGRRAFFTDANGAVARAAWEKAPFRRVPYAEDHQLAIDMLRAGFAKVYVPDAAVEHSHDYAPAELFRRCFDEWRGLREIYGWVEPLRARSLRDKVLIPARADVRELRAEGAPPAALAALAGRSGAHHAIRLAGALAGSRADRLAPRLRARLSLERRATFGE